MREGYKVTEIGDIPESWEVVKLKDVGNIITGNTPSTSNRDFYNEEGNGFLWASPADLGDSKLVNKTKSTLTVRGFEQTRKIKPGAILVTCIGSTIGKIGMARFPMSTNQQINSLVCNEKNDCNFHFYILASKAGYLKTLAGTQAVPLLNKTDFSNILVPLPPLPEQQKIASILSTVDEKIENIDAQISQTRELKKSLMQQLLTKGIGHTKFKSSELGDIPQSWKVVKLSSICDKITDGSHYSPVPNKDTGFLIATVKDMQANRFNLNTCVNISKDEFNALERNGCRPIANDILFSKDGTIGKTFVFDGSQDVVLLSSVAIIRLKANDYDPGFICQFLKSEFFYKQLEGLKSGSAIRRLVLGAIKSIRISLPSVIEQKKIACILNTVDLKLESLQSRKETYQQLKKGLMQQLLTGKLRVNVNELAFT